MAWFLFLERQGLTLSIRDFSRSRMELEDFKMRGKVGKAMVAAKRAYSHARDNEQRSRVFEIERWINSVFRITHLVAHIARGSE